MFNTALGGYVLLYLIFITVSFFRLNREYLHFINMEFEMQKLRSEYETRKINHHHTAK